MPSDKGRAVFPGKKEEILEGEAGRILYTHTHSLTHTHTHSHTHTHTYVLILYMCPQTTCPVYTYVLILQNICTIRPSSQH